MRLIQAKFSALLDAPAKAVYTVLRDYRHAHPAILPEKYFSGLEVVRGGVGQGTEIRFQMTVSGRTSHFHQVVEEPEIGRVLVERDLKRELRTTFTIEDCGKQSQVTISTEFSASPGLAGFAERIFFPGIAKKIYRLELQNLERYIHSNGLRAE